MADAGSSTAHAPKAQYQVLAHQLPAGEILLVLPPGNGEDATLQKIANLFRAKERRVTVLRAAQLSGQETE